MVREQQEKPSDFSQLGPDRVLSLAEKAMAVRCNNLFRPLNSYINRVFEVETVDRTRLVVKFYRPGRWTKSAILNEHAFLRDLADREIPVIAPHVLKNGKTLAENYGLFYSIFPKCGGRSVDEFTDDQWLQLGRLLGRVHQVGEKARAQSRITMTPKQSTAAQLGYILGSSCVPADLKSPLEKAARGIIDQAAPLFRDTGIIRIHGDCQFSNIIHRPGESFFLIDFDDMAMGPPIQDIWMLLPGDLSDSVVELDLFLEGYETFRPFDRTTLRLVEPLRAMRYIHYMAWCVHQVERDGFTRAIDGFGTWEYWQKEIADLHDQQRRIAEYRPASGNC